MREFIFGLMMFIGLCGNASALTRWDVSFAKPEISKPADVQCEVGDNVFYNEWYGHSWIMHNPGSSYVLITFNKDASVQGPARLLVHHLASTVNGNYNYSPVDILVNDVPFKTHYNPNSGNWVYDIWDLPDGSLVDGTNTVLIRFCEDAGCNYWLNRVSILVD